MARICIADKPCVCLVCGQGFLAKYRKTRFCSEPCRHVRELQQWHDRRAAKGIPTKGHPAPCQRCGSLMEITTARTKFCSECRKVEDAEKSQRWRVQNPDAVRETQRSIDQRRKTCPKRIASVRISAKARDRRVRSTPRGCLDHRMGQLVRSGLGTAKGGRKWETLVGYSIADLMAHLERQFLKGMSWENIGEWHVDHILAKSSFTYETVEDPEFRACWALTNLRPLWSGDNIKKGKKRLFLL